MMRALVIPLLGAVVLLGASLAAAQSPADRNGSASRMPPSTLGTGSCSGTLGAEPGCLRPQDRPVTGPDGNAGSDSDDRIGSHTPSTDLMGPDAVARGGAGAGPSGSGADGLGGGDSGR